MADPILLDVGITGADDVLQQMQALGQGIGAALSAPNAQIDQLNQSINALGATITKLGTASTAAAQQLQGVAAADAAFKALTTAAVDFQTSLDESTHSMEGFNQILQTLGNTSQHAGQQIHQMGESGGAAAASFKLLQTSIGSVVEVLAGGGLRAGVSAIKELGEGVDSVASHFGKLGEEVAKGAQHFVTFAAVAGTAALGIKELADLSAEDTLEIHALASAMGVGEAEALQLKGALTNLGISMDQIGQMVRSVATRMQNEWVSIQKAVRDAKLPIEQDQIAIKESTMAVAEAEETAATAAADAERAHAEAVVNASEAVIHAKEAEFDAQNKVADAQRAYGDAVVNANEAQLNYADAQKEFEYSGQDAWRGMKDAIDAVADAERKAADEATAVQEALLSIDEAATSVKGAYVSLYAAQLAYREAHGGARITAAERAQMRRGQTEVGLESAEERVRGAEFQYARTRRDAIPEAEERQARAERGVGAAREAEDKAQQRYAESATRAADKLEKSGSEAASALERLAKAGLELELAPQKAADETAQAQLQVEGALANVRKTGFEATMASARAEDALRTARLAQQAAQNKAVDDLNNNINSVLQLIRTGRGPSGFDVRMTSPETIAQAAAFQSGGGPGALGRQIDILQRMFNLGQVSMDRWQAVMLASGFPRSTLEPGRFMEAFQPPKPGEPLPPPISTTPSLAQQARGATLAGRVEADEEMETQSRKAASAVRDLADDIGNIFIPAVTHAATAIAEHPGEAAVGAGALVVGEYVGGRALTAAMTAFFQNIFQKFAGAGGAAALTTAAGAHTTAAAQLSAAAAQLSAAATVGKEAAAAETEAAAAETTAAGAEQTAAAAETEAAVALRTSGGGFPGGLGGGKGLGLRLGLLDTGQLDIDAQQSDLEKEYQRQKTAGKNVMFGGLWPFGGRPAAPETPAAPAAPAAPPGMALPELKPGEVIPPDAGPLPTAGTAPGATPAPPPYTGQGEKPEVGGMDVPASRLVGAADHLDLSAVKLGEAAERLGAPKTTGAAAAPAGAPGAPGASTAAEPAAAEKPASLLSPAQSDFLKKYGYSATPSGAATGGLSDPLAAPYGAATGGLSAAPPLYPGAAAGGGGGGAYAAGGGGPVASWSHTANQSEVDAITAKSMGMTTEQFYSTYPQRRPGYSVPTQKGDVFHPEVGWSTRHLPGVPFGGWGDAGGDTGPPGTVEAGTGRVMGSATEYGQKSAADLGKAAQDLSKAASDQKTSAGDLSEAAEKQKQQPGGQAAGGLIYGAGGPTEDNIPIMASAGEYVVNAASTSKHRSLLDMINEGSELHFQHGGPVGFNPQSSANVMGMIRLGGGTEPSVGAIQNALTSSSGMGPGGYMMAKMQAQMNPTYAVDLRTDHGTFAVLATEDQMGSMLQSSISSKIASTGVKPSWWS